MFRYVRLHELFIEVVSEKGVELVIANAVVSVEWPLAQNFPLVDMEFGKTLYEDFVVVVHAYNRIQLNFDIGINLADVFNFLTESL